MKKDGIETRERMSAEGQRRGAGRREGSPAPLSITVAWDVCFLSFLDRPSPTTHHPSITAGHLLCPGPGSIQAVSLGRDLAWEPSSPRSVQQAVLGRLSTMFRPGQGTGLSGGGGNGWGQSQRWQLRLSWRV